MFQEKFSRVQLLKRQRDHPGKDQGTNVNITANLSMLRHIDQSNQVTSIWYHGLAASKACLQVPLPFPFPIAFNFLYLLLTFFHPLRGSRSQANVKGRLLLTQSEILIQVPFLVAKKVGL